MYNANKPNIDELPSSAQLIKSTVIAAVAAIVILATVVLPAEYGIDPTRIGQALGLTSMGEIKQQLAEEAEKDHQTELGGELGGELGNSIVNNLIGLFITSAQASEKADGWTEEVSFVLSPGEGTEIKLEMDADASAQYLWKAEGGKINFDLHGDGKGQSISYKKGRGTEGDEGTLVAAFTGKHGWFWRNRDRQDVTITLYVKGNFKALVRLD